MCPGLDRVLDIADWLDHYGRVGWFGYGSGTMHGIKHQESLLEEEERGERKPKVLNQNDSYSRKKTEILAQCVRLRSQIKNLLTYSTIMRTQLNFWSISHCGK